MRYYISDCHFFHRALLTKMDERGFEDVYAMNDYMIAKWNAKVRKNDEVIILGDFSYGNKEETREVLNKLNGKLFLILGNHDRFDKEKEYGADRFEWIKPYAEMHDNRRKIVLCHYPIMFYNGQYKLDEAGKPSTYMLYGHVHDSFDERLLNHFINETRNSKRVNPDGKVRAIPCQMINCFCMYSDYTPLTLDEWIENDRLRREKENSETKKETF